MSRLLWLLAFGLAAPSALVAAVLALMVVVPPRLPAPPVAGRVLSATTAVYEAADTNSSSVSGQAVATDGRAVAIRNYLRQYSSPLEPHAQELVEIGDKHGVDPNLLVAIAQQESNLCKKMPANSYNCWGFGIYGNKVTRFPSYPEAIDTVAKTLRKKYIDQGLDTPEEIMRRYTPPSVDIGGPWAMGIRQFLEELQ